MKWKFGFIIVLALLTSSLSQAGTAKGAVIECVSPTDPAGFFFWNKPSAESWTQGNIVDNYNSGRINDCVTFEDYDSPEKLIACKVTWEVPQGHPTTAIKLIINGEDIRGSMTRAWPHHGELELQCKKRDL